MVQVKMSKMARLQAKEFYEILIIMAYQSSTSIKTKKTA